MRKMPVLSEFTFRKINKQPNKTESIETKLLRQMYRADGPNGGADFGPSEKKSEKKTVRCFARISEQRFIGCRHL